MRRKVERVVTHGSGTIVNIFTAPLPSHMAQGKSFDGETCSGDNYLKGEFPHFGSISSHFSGHEEKINLPNVTQYCGFNHLIHIQEKKDLDFRNTVSL